MNEDKKVYEVQFHKTVWEYKWIEATDKETAEKIAEKERWNGGNGFLQDESDWYVDDIKELKETDTIT